MVQEAQREEQEEEAYREPKGADAGEAEEELEFEPSAAA
jgi:hypothetical protein